MIETEKGEVLDFEPLSADVAPQMTLFGPAPTAPAPVITRVPEPMPMPVPLPASEADATAMIVNGFFDFFVKELPMEYAVELNRLIKMEMEGSVG